MREVRFHRELYRGELVDQAIKVYERYATIERDEDDAYWTVRVIAESPERERRVADELANYALGLTIQKRGGG
ncbi:MAG TPA: HxsD-like protein [Sandaracinaceae bacterium]